MDNSPILLRRERQTSEGAYPGKKNRKKREGRSGKEDQDATGKGKEGVIWRVTW